MFKVGDYVTPKVDYGERFGQVGIVRVKDIVTCGVEFDSPNGLNHDCNGHTRHRCGWFFADYNLNHAVTPYDPTQQGDTADDV